MACPHSAGRRGRNRPATIIQRARNPYQRRRDEQRKGVVGSAMCLCYQWARGRLLRDGSKGLENRFMDSKRPTLYLFDRPSCFPCLLPGLQLNFHCRTVGRPPASCICQLRLLGLGSRAHASGRRFNYGAGHQIRRYAACFRPFLLQCLGADNSNKDNIVKGFATSLAIIISSLFSFLLFDFQITITFVIGAAIVVGATWMYNSTPPPSPPPLSPTVKHPSTLMNAQRRSVSPGGTGPLPVNSSVQYRPGDPPPAYRRPPNTSAQTPDAFIPSFDHRIEVVDSQASPSLGGLDGFDGFSARKL